MALFSEFFQSAPRVPEFKPISPQAEQATAITGNTANLPALEAQATEVNRFNVDQLQKMLEQAIPGYAKIRDKASGAIQDWLSGNVPADVSAQVQRNAAGSSLYGGFGGSGMARNLSARDLGLTSLNLIGKGLDSAERWIAATKTPQFDISSMFIKPEFQTQFAASERNAKFQRDYIKNIYDQQYSGAANWARFEDTVAQLAGAIIGGSSSTYSRPSYSGVSGVGGSSGNYFGSGNADFGNESYNRTTTGASENDFGGEAMF